LRNAMGDAASRFVREQRNVGMAATILGETIGAMVGQRGAGG